MSKGTVEDPRPEPGHGEEAGPSTNLHAEPLNAGRAGRMSRRALLSTMGAAGAAVVTGGLLNAFHGGGVVTEVNGAEGGGSGSTPSLSKSILEYGAANDGSAPAAAIIQQAEDELHALASALGVPVTLTYHSIAGNWSIQARNCCIHAYESEQFTIQNCRFQDYSEGIVRTFSKNYRILDNILDSKVQGKSIEQFYPDRREDAHFKRRRS